MMGLSRLLVIARGRRSRGNPGYAKPRHGLPRGFAARNDDGGGGEGGRERKRPNANEGGIAATLTAPAAFTGVWRPPRGRCVARRSRRHPVPSGGGWSPKALSLPPGGSAAFQSVGGPAFHLVLPGRSLALPSTPSRTFRPTDGLPLTFLSLATRLPEDLRPKTVAICLLPNCAVVAIASRSVFLVLRLIRPCGFLRFRSGFPVSMIGRCAQGVSRSRRARPTYPLSPELAVDKCG